MLAKKLKKGDKIGVISPSENVKEEDFADINESIELLKKNGYEVVIGKNAYKNTTGYGATAKEKAEILKQMLDSPISDELPSTILKLHPNFTIICDKDAASLLDMKDYPEHRM